MSTMLTQALLVGAGGLSKASWKLCWVLTRQDLAVLDNLLFILIAPGFAWLAAEQALWGLGQPTCHGVELPRPISVDAELDHLSEAAGLTACSSRSDPE